MSKLTKRTVDGLASKEIDYFAWDGELKGFGVRILPSGRKTFVARYRSGGRQHRMKIGVYGTITTDEARTLARQLLGDVAKGENPAEDISAHRQAPSVASVCQRFLSEHVAQRCKPSTQGEYRRSVELFIIPALGTRKIGEITRADVARLHHRMRDTPYQANRTLGVISKMFNLAELWGLRPDGTNPCRHVPRYRERNRERFLTHHEIANLGKVLDEVETDRSESASAVAAFRLLLLTGCRLKEIQTLKWDYIDGRYFVLPDSKTGARKIPITPAVRDILENIERLPDNDYVITGKVAGQHLTDLHHPWERIRAHAGLDDVRIHDLRHTYASSAVAAGQSLVMIGKLLGHTQIQTTARYAHLADEPVHDAALIVAESLEQSMSRRLSERDDAPAVGDGEIVEFQNVTR